MSLTNRPLDEQIDHLYRHEYGKIVAVLTKTFGPENMHTAEDVTQEAMVEAVRQWTYRGIPDNPAGWIYKVAKFKAINLIKKERLRYHHQDAIKEHLHSDKDYEPNIDFGENEIADDQLKMIFTCCHPSISSDSQVALTLKTLCGLSIPEIAAAFLTSEENINKRLVRARKQLREEKVSFDVPDHHSMETRLISVLEVIYLMFNEGYQALHGSELIRFELCEEAIRLGEILAAHPAVKHKPTVFALLALMNFNAARFASRMDDAKILVDLEHQERELWDQQRINKGLVYLELSAQQMEVSLYHILATISAHHCTAKSYEQTDWPSILELYDHLLQIDQSDIVRLNRAVVLSKVKGPKEGLEALVAIAESNNLMKYLPFYTVKADLLFQNGLVEGAIATLRKALKLNINEKFKGLISSKIGQYQENN